jgi:predicted N-acetyltransferase YhbS
MNPTIRHEIPSDYETVEKITYEAFKNLPESGDEALLAHKLRSCESFVKELDFVAVADGEVVGNIMYSKAKIVNENGENFDILTFGPLSVIPEMQKKGIGKALVEHSLKIAKDMRFTAVVIFGHPEYYMKLGFENCGKYYITTTDGESPDYLMIYIFDKKAVEKMSGKVIIDEVYLNLDKKENEEFNKKFKEDL